MTYRYLSGRAIDSLLARWDGTNALWYLTDKLGSVRQDVTTTGSVSDQIVYDSYGNILSETSPSNGDRFKFTGREWDSEIGLYFNRARYYGPSDGRFESEDPSGFGAGDLDLFRYVNNSPTNASDPTGLWPRWRRRPPTIVIVPVPPAAPSPSSPGGPTTTTTYKPFEPGDGQQPGQLQPPGGTITVFNPSNPPDEMRGPIGRFLRWYGRRGGRFIKISEPPDTKTRPTYGPAIEIPLGPKPRPTEPPR